MKIEISIEEAELIIEQYFRQTGWDLLHDFSEKGDPPRHVKFDDTGPEDNDYCFVAFTSAP